MGVPRIGREIGRQAFGLDPGSYHCSRPDYPQWAFDALRDRCGVGPWTAAFEIGAGTGKATGHLLELGVRSLLAVEPDSRLADFLRANHPHPALRVCVSTFEDVALEACGFDFGLCATAFHWLDEDAALAKIARTLRPGGWWAAIWNVFGDDRQDDPFHEATKTLLSGPATPSAGERGIPFALDTNARTAALERAGTFESVDVQTSRWPLVLDADQTMALYGTYSNINVRPDRAAVLAELGRIAREEFGGRVVGNMTTSLYVARRT